MTKEDANSIVWNRGKVTSGLNDKNDLSNSASLYVKKYHDRSIM